MEDTLADALGTLTGVTLSGLMAETMPQLRFVLRRRGRILWPRIQPIVEAAFQPSEDGIRQIIQSWREHQRGETRHPTHAEQERGLAWRITASRWTGEAVENQEYEGKKQADAPIPGVSAEAAAAALAWAQSSDCPDDVYVQFVAPVVRGLRASAAKRDA